MFKTKPTNQYKTYPYIITIVTMIIKLT